MKKKITLLVSIYYSLFILSSCCDDEHYWIYFNEVKTLYTNYYDVEFQVRPQNEIIEDSDDFVGKGLLASLKNFNSVNAFSPGCDETFSYEKYLVGFKVTSDIAFIDSIMPGDSLNDLFAFNTGTAEELFYDSELAHFKLVLFDTTWTERKLYFEYEFDNGDIILDTLDEVILRPTY